MQVDVLPLTRPSRLHASGVGEGPEVPFSVYSPDSFSKGYGTKSSPNVNVGVDFVPYACENLPRPIFGLQNSKMVFLSTLPPQCNFSLVMMFLIIFIVEEITNVKIKTFFFIFCDEKIVVFSCSR